MLGKSFSIPCGRANSIYTVSSHHFFAGCEDGTIKLFSISKEKSEIKLLHTMYGHTRAVRGVEHDGTSRILSYGDESIFKVWNFSENRKPAMLKTFFVE